MPDNGSLLVKRMARKGHESNAMQKPAASLLCGEGGSLLTMPTLIAFVACLYFALLSSAISCPSLVFCSAPLPHSNTVSKYAEFSKQQESEIQCGCPLFRTLDWILFYRPKGEGAGAGPRTLTMSEAGRLFGLWSFDYSYFLPPSPFFRLDFRFLEFGTIATILSVHLFNSALSRFIFSMLLRRTKCLIMDLFL
jgi:hypothetical protein